MNFEILTYVPIDLDAILPEKMSTEEKEMLNHYHKQVYEKVSPYLSEEERIWLKEYTRAVITIFSSNAGADLSPSFQRKLIGPSWIFNK